MATYLVVNHWNASGFADLDQDLLIEWVNDTHAIVSMCVHDGLQTQQHDLSNGQRE
jgi:hypothetical protein